MNSETQGNSMQIISRQLEAIKQGIARDDRIVFAYPIKPNSFKGTYFIRKHNSNHLMSLSEIANEHLKTLNLSWDFAIDPRHDLEDIILG